AVVETVLDEWRDVEVRLTRVTEVALIPEFHVVRPRDVGHGGAHLRERTDLMALETLLKRLVESIDQTRDARNRRIVPVAVVPWAAGGAFFDHRDHLVVVRAVDARREVR